MARAGRNARKHAASARRSTAATGSGAPRHKAGDPHHGGATGRAATVAGAAVLALSLAGTVATGELGDHPADVPAPTTSAPAAVDFSVRTAQVSRSISRAVSRAAVQPLATARTVVLRPTAVGHLFSTAPLNLRTGPSADSRLVRVVPFATRLAVTGQSVGGFAEVLVRREVPASARGAERTRARTVAEARWVNADYLAKRKPKPPTSEPATDSTTQPTTQPTTDLTTQPSGASPAPTSSPSTVTSSGVSTAPCPDGSATESGLTSNAVALYRAVCAAFPALTTYGGWDPHGEHSDGRAIDFMVSDSSLGQAVADWVRANSGALRVYDVIWAQHIWTPERSSEGWRGMEDRGSPTANHDDHVHVAVY